jgi:rhomboid protease GluP
MGAKVTPLIALGQYWRLFTAMFLHIGLMHLLFNGYALSIVGTELERFLGWQRFLAVFLLSGLFGNLASYASSTSLAAGASGAVFGLIGALGAFFYRYRDRLGTWGRSRLINVVILVVLNLTFGFLYPGIDNMAHLGGLLAGIGLGWVLAPRYELDVVGMRLVDRNNWRHYWPALALAGTLLVGGTVLTTLARRGDPENHVQLGYYALDQDAWDEAVAEFQQALAQDPTLLDAYLLMGQAYYNKGDYASAASALESALTLEPDNPEIHSYLAFAYLRLQRYEKARDHFEIFRELHPPGAQDVDPILDELNRILP